MNNEIGTNGDKTFPPTTLMASVESDVMKSSVKCSQLQPVVNSSLPDDDRIHNSFAKMQDAVKDVNIHRDLYGGMSKNSDTSGSCKQCSQQRQYSSVNSPVNSPSHDMKTSLIERQPSRQKKACKVFCWTGWIVCCPLWTLIFCLREPPLHDEDEFETDDVCWPCSYDTTVEVVKKHR